MIKLIKVEGCYILIIKVSKLGGFSVAMRLRQHMVPSEVLRNKLPLRKAIEGKNEVYGSGRRVRSSCGINCFKKFMIIQDFRSAPQDMQVWSMGFVDWPVNL